MSVTSQKDLKTPLGYAVADAARLLSIHPKTLRKLIKEGQVHAVKLGRRVVIPKATLDRFLEGKK